MGKGNWIAEAIPPYSPGDHKSILGRPPELVSITVAIKIKTEATPYDPAYKEYFEKRADLYKELGIDFKLQEDLAEIQKLKDHPELATSAATTVR